MGTRRSASKRGKAGAAARREGSRRRGRGRDRSGPAQPDGEDAAAAVPGPRPFWSGTISFGLVAVPVQLYPSTRSAGPTTRMLAPDDTPIQRRFVCSAEETDVDRDELVRGFEIERDQHVVVTDDELDALAPRKSRDIDLRLFTPVASIDPMRFEKAYVLTPAGDTTKPYRLLAAVMEQEGKAGIATFVMRNREQLVAILARRGILWAQTLRFADELRDPDEQGIPAADDASADLVARFTAAIDALEADDVDRSELRAQLRDARLDRLQALIDDKRERGADIVVARNPEGRRAAHPADDGFDADSDAGEDREGAPDLFEVIRARLRGEQAKDGSAAPRGAAKRSRRKQAPSTRASLDEELAKLNKSELYARAKQADVPGRSDMTKGELIDALRERA